MIHDFAFELFIKGTILSFSGFIILYDYSYCNFEKKINSSKNHFLLESFRIGYDLPASIVEAGSLSAFKNNLRNYLDV